MLKFLDHFKMPTITDRVSISGKTGSGKTTAGLFLLSEMPLGEMPWIIFDYKGDDLIGKLPAIEWRPEKDPPKDPGLYRMVCSPFLSHDEDPIDEFLKKVWRQTYTGLFFDEAYMLPDRFGKRERGTLRALFTTGRSRKIPIISLTQRPMDVTKYNFSEASHHVIFRLNDKRDRDTVRGRVPNEEFDSAFGENGTGLPTFHSLWYSVDDDKVFQMTPFPPPDEVLKRFEWLKELHRWM